MWSFQIGQSVLVNVIASGLFAVLIVTTRWFFMFSKYRLALGENARRIVTKPFTYYGVQIGMAHLVEFSTRFNPDIVVGINRGGAIVGGILCKYLGEDTYIHVIEVKNDEPIAPNSNLEDLVKGKKVLLVNDRFNSGEHIRKAKNYLKPRCHEIRTIVFAYTKDTKKRNDRGIELDHYAYPVHSADVALPWEPSHQPSQYGK